MCPENDFSSLFINSKSGADIGQHVFTGHEHDVGKMVILAIDSKISTSSAFASIFWDSGSTTMATTTAGTRSPDISYAGSSLASSTTYYWRIKFWDASTTISKILHRRIFGLKS